MKPGCAINAARSPKLRSHAAIAWFGISPLRLNLGGLALMFLISFLYLEVPLLHSVLTPLYLVLQAGLGVRVLQWISPQLESSALLLLGPGLILGSALAFGVFQVSGRGWFGGVSVVIVCLLATVSRRSRVIPNKRDSLNLSLVVQILGLAAFSLTWEFPELLFPAFGFFIIGLVQQSNSSLQKFVSWITQLIALSLIVFPLFMRQRYWWLVTEDYQFLQVLSKHLVTEGPLANWGAADFSRYHWLSYGWSGLLDFLSMSSAPFVTLTRVMPFVYSASLASSVLLVRQMMSSNRRNDSIAFVSAWVVIGITTMDWSGTSTAGVYAASAAAVVVAMWLIQNSISISRRFVTYLLFAAVVALTKLPSIFAVVLAIFLLEVGNLLRQKKRSSMLALYVTASALASVFVFGGVIVSSTVVDRFRVVGLSPDLGQFGAFGLNFAIFTVVLQNVNLIFFLGLAFAAIISSRRKVSAPITDQLVISLIPLVGLGLLLRLTVTGHANIADYFSKPFLFLASLALLVDLQDKSAEIQLKLRISPVLLMGGLWLASYLWEKLGVARYLWQLASDGILKLDSQQIALLEFVTSGQQYGLTFFCASVLALASITRRVRPLPLVGLLLFAFALAIFTGYSEPADSELRRIRSTEEIADNLGSEESQEVARWLHENSSRTDLIATNSLIDSDSGNLNADFSLAAWSNREFLVLGPRFLGEFESIDSAFRSSMHYGDSGIDTKPDSLRELGVDFFVFDKRISPWPERSGLPAVLFENERFFIIEF